jgi:NAD(P)-dependent dehydrogenase (short-subunit alcohol dehydrogenase family)
MEFTDAEKKLAGGVAVITGAGAGLGAGFARRAATLGMIVYVTDVSLERAESVVDEILKLNGTAHALAVDVSKPSELDRLADHVYSRHDNVRLLINNAGIETMGLSWEIPASRWDTTLDINVRGVIHGVRAFAPRMIASGEECWIGNLASVGAFGVMPTQSAYILSKHAIQSFSECLYTEMQLVKANVHVCSIMPGMVKTSIFEQSAGKGEASGADVYRTRMREMMAAYGMDLEEGCRIMMAELAEGRFWVRSQPEMIKDAIAKRVDFLQEQRDPEIAESARALVGL